MTEYKYRVSDFEGPLDLLLYLIEKNKVDIYNIPIVDIADQFNAYVADIDTFDVDYASKFFVMAATLLQINPGCFCRNSLKRLTTKKTRRKSWSGSSSSTKR